MPHYTYLWEFRVAPERREEFARVYGPQGDWAVLFRRASGYLGTLLLHDAADPERFVTVDRWDREADFRAFKATFAHEYASLDARCEHLTLGRDRARQLRGGLSSARRVRAQGGGLPAAGASGEDANRMQPTHFKAGPRRAPRAGLFLFAALAVSLLAHGSEIAMQEAARIEYLIATLGSLPQAQFIRNGTTYDAKAAVDHLRLKLRFAGSRVRTAEDFIRYCATESTVSGEPYQIRFADGHVVPSAQYFRQKLGEYDRQHRETGAGGTGAAAHGR